MKRKYKYILWQANYCEDTESMEEMQAIISKESYSSVDSAALAAFKYALAHPEDYCRLTVESSCYLYLELKLYEPGGHNFRKGGPWYE